MAGKGRPPKNPNELSSKSKRVKPFKETIVEFGSQPSLEDVIGVNNPITGMPWTHSSLLLWSQLSDFPTTRNLLPAQWSSLARAFMLDDALMSGDQKMAVEARMRLSKYGIDPDDLLRMRVIVSTSDHQESEASPMNAQRKARLVKLVESSRIRI